MTLSRSQALWLFIIFVGIFRFTSLAFYPLLDPTEARYGEIARIMVETDNWITPQIDYDRPFWGKPPLYAWASALSISLLGNSEFNLRLPHFLAGILILFLIWKFVNHLKLSSINATYAVAITISSVGFIVAAGVIMTDMLLTLSMTMAMVSFWRSWHGDRVYNLMLYSGIGIGLLAKGPLIIVLTGLALFPWLVIEVGFFRMWKQIWLRLNIIQGLIIVLLISAPWYILSERATPGFLEYFLVGEHFQRFIDSNWQGDLYGSGHPEPLGSIWIHWFLLGLPWSPLFIWGVFRHFKSSQQLHTGYRSLNLFLVLWMCSPLILFTLARNILPAYVLPGLPAIGILIILYYDLTYFKEANLLFLFTPIFLLLVILFVVGFLADNKSDKFLLQSGISSNHPLYYYKNRPYSAQYYSNGRASMVNTLPTDRKYYLAVKKENIPQPVDSICQKKSENKERILFFCQRN